MIECFKKLHGYTDEDIIASTGISACDFEKISNSDFKDLGIDAMVKLSLFLSVPIDDLIASDSFTPFDVFKDSEFSKHYKADKDYSQFSILMGDLLYVRPFISLDEHFSSLLLLIRDSQFDIQRYSKSFDFSSYQVFKICGVCRLNPS